MVWVGYSDYIATDYTFRNNKLTKLEESIPCFKLKIHIVGNLKS